MKKVLFIDDQLDLWIDILKEELSRFGFEVIGESDPANTLSMIKKHSPDVIMLDILFGDRNLGRPTLEKIKEKYPHIPVMMITTTMDKAEYNPDDYRLAEGKYFKDLLREKKDFIDLANQLNAIMEKTNNKDVFPIVDDLIIGYTPKMKEVYEVIQKVSPTDATIMITGESGTGKERVARVIVKKSKRAQGPFVSINCAAIPDNLLESELFGHEKGAFTGAIRDKPGKFELADKGTIFLDEIGDLAPDLQGKVLRVLQEKEIDRVGGTKPLNVDVRIMAATNKNLQEEVKKGTFREDLFYRLNVVHIDLPPLRERKEDLKIFYEHFVEKYSKESGKRIAANLREDVLEKFNAYDWPVNIREFENAIEKAFLLTSNPVLQLEDFNFIELKYASQNIFAPPTDIIFKIWNSELTLEDLNEIYKQKSLSPIIKSLVDKWLSEKKLRPKHRELAELLKTTDEIIRQVFRKCGLELTRDWPKKKKE